MSSISAGNSPADRLQAAHSALELMPGAMTFMCIGMGQGIGRLLERV